MPGSIRRGGGFLIYHSTKAPGHYSFSMQLRRGGGFMKSKRLQWFVGFKDTKNYINFQLDGKRLTVKRIVNGKSEELQKAPFEADLDNYVQIDLGVKPDSVSTRLRTADGAWQNMGTATVQGEDLTKGSFGVLISGNDEVGVSTVHYGK
jgi:tRNA U34 2-thiouridine synthase MnmA/TrmU